MSHEVSDSWSPPVRRRLFLMRHGEVDYFTPEGRPVPHATVSLSGLGRDQAAAAAAALAGVPFDVAVCSGLPRTRETAERVLAGRGVTLTDEPRLREIEPGRLSEWAVGDAAAVRRIILDGLSDVGPGSSFLAGETFGAVARRVREALDDLLARPWGTALVVAHSVVNRLILSWALDSPLSALGRFEQDACCVNLIEWHERTPLVRLVNHTPWAPAKEGLTHSTLEGLYLQFLRGK
jgi:phosphoserine phosphatase